MPGLTFVHYLTGVVYIINSLFFFVPQTINAHTAAICACAFSPDGKFLVSYSATENKLSFWQTSTGMFGLGNSQTKCTKSYSTQIHDTSRSSQQRQIKLHWASNRSVRFFSDGLESTFVI
jgi:WD40 repeat protein